MTLTHAEAMGEIFAGYRDMKRDATKDDDVEDDIPMLLYLGSGPMSENEHTDVLCIVIPEGDYSTLCHALSRAMAQMFVPYWVAVLTDGYVANLNELPDERPAGGLRDLYAAGVKGVSECLTITSATHAGEEFMSTSRYTFDDDHDIWFDEEDACSDEPARSMGPMITMIREIVGMYGMSQLEILAHMMKVSGGAN